MSEKIQQQYTCAIEYLVQGIKGGVTKSFCRYLLYVNGKNEINLADHKRLWRSGENKFILP